MSVLWVTTRHSKRELRSRDGFLLVSLGWTLMSAIATVPLLMALPGLSFTDAFFETMSGLSFYQGVAQTLWQNKLFHIDLNDQRIGRFDQDFRFGSEGIKDHFFLVRLLENSGYSGVKHFDAHAYRTEDMQGVWDFARGCIRNYLAFRQKAAAFDSDPRVQQAMAYTGVAQLAEPTVGAYSASGASALMAENFDVDALAQRGFGIEALDQLAVDHILGIA